LLPLGFCLSKLLCDLLSHKSAPFPMIYFAYDWMFEGTKSGITVNGSFLSLNVLSYLAVLSPEEQQRIAVANHHVFDFRNEDGVIAGLLGGVQAAFQVGERAIEHRGPVPGTVKTCAGLGFSMLVAAIRTRVVFRNCPLVLAQHIDAEALLGVQMGMGARVLIDAYQHQQWVERYRGKCIGGHAVDFAFQVDRDDGYPGGEAAHGFAEFRRIQSHIALDLLP